MKVVVCNIGSTSLKFQLLQMPEELRLARGSIERVGSGGSGVRFWIEDREVWSGTESIPDHRASVQRALDFLVSGPQPLLDSLSSIDGIGFKTVQAGEMNGSVLLDGPELEAMEEYSDLAPAHNPPYLEAIKMFRALLPQTPLVGVFEPGFHVDAPEYARVYGVPYDWITRYGVRRYGYHGASHRYVTGEVLRILGLPSEDHKIVSCHLGGSSSICAFKNGRSIDTSMGFSPQSGLIQGTRIGDLDPFVLPFIMKRKGISLEQALIECSRNAGLAGLSGTSGDMRDILDRIANGDRRAQLARDKFIYDVKRYLGSYLVLMEGLDAVVFTGGIGQRDADLRAQVMGSLKFLGVRIDTVANFAHERVFSSVDSRVKALVVATDEEVVVARETVRVLGR